MVDRLYFYVCNHCGRTKESYVNLDGESCYYCDDGKFEKVYSVGCKD